MAVITSTMRGGDISYGAKVRAKRESVRAEGDERDGVAGVDGDGHVLYVAVVAGDDKEDGVVLDELEQAAEETVVK